MQKIKYKDEGITFALTLLLGIKTIALVPLNFCLQDWVSKEGNAREG